MKRVITIVLVFSLLLPNLKAQLAVPGLHTTNKNNEFGGVGEISIYGHNTILRSSTPRYMLGHIEIEQPVLSIGYLTNRNNGFGLYPTSPALLSEMNVYKSRYAICNLENGDNGIFLLVMNQAKIGRKKLSFNTSYSIDQIDNQNNIFQTGSSLTNSFAINKGEEESSFSLMASNTTRKSVIPGSASSNTTVGFNNDAKLFSGAKLLTEIYWINKNINELPQYSGNTGLMYALANNSDHAENLIANNNSKYESDIVLPNIKLSFNFYEGLDVDYSASANLSEASQKDNLFSVDYQDDAGFHFSAQSYFQSVTHGPLIKYEERFRDHELKAMVAAKFTDFKERLDVNQFYGEENTADELKYEKSYHRDTYRGKLDYNFNSQFLFSGAYGYIHNNLYPEIDAIQQYSLAAGWNYTNMRWFQVSFISSGKIAFGYDVVESAPPVFMSPTLVRAQQLTGSDLLYPSKLFEIQFVEGIQPESKQMFTIQHEMTMFDGKLSFDVELYQSTTKNLFLPLDLENIVVGNDGEIISKGVNLRLDFRHGLSGDIYLDQKAIFSLNRSVVQGITDDRVVSIAGIDNVRACAVNNQPYGILIHDNGEKANPNPDWILHYQGEFAWRGIALNVLCQWKQGGQMWNEQMNSFEDASRFKVNRMTFSYALNSNITNRLKMNYLSFYLYAENLLTVTNYSGASTDTHFLSNTNSSGIDYYNLPEIKRFGAGLKIEF